MKKDRQLMVTLTGEPIQIARIYYEVLDRMALLRKFHSLRCVRLDQQRNRWVWEYAREAAQLKFDKPHDKNLGDIVLGSFFFKSNSALVLDVRSFERVTKAIAFFDQRIASSIMRVTEVAVVNRLFDKLEDIPADWDFYFTRPDVVRREPEKLLQQVEQLKHAGPQTEQMRWQIMDEMIKDANRPQPEIERFPTNFYEDGIEALQSALKMRTVVAWEHFQGNTNFSFNDLIQRRLGTRL
ncbi:MAG: hypothetical protein HOP19_26160 [Acidobacteria bacterium]|nr:hypothetical protein [Acidobacteriota bacterium]